MRKLLKLVAIAVLLAVGSNQAFAKEATPSDWLRVTIPDAITSATFAGTTKFRFFDVAGVDMLLQGATYIAVPHPLFTPTIQGAFTLALGNKALVVTEPGDGISDVLTLNIALSSSQPINTQLHQYDLTLNFYDAGDVNLPGIFANFSPATCNLSNVTCVSETLFDTARDVTQYLGLTTESGVTVQFKSHVAAIPESEIYAMLAAGLGLMGFVARRRRQQSAAA